MLVSSVVATMKEFHPIPRGMWTKSCFVILLVATITVGYCDGQQLIETALDILRAKGLDGNLRMALDSQIPSDDSVPLSTTFDGQHPLEDFHSNRTLLWINYSAVTQYKGPMDQDFLNSISMFWLTATPPSPKAHFGMAILYIFMMTIGISGNAFVLFMFFKCRSLRTPANTFVLNLAISDFMMMCKIPIIIHNSLNYGPQLGAWACQLYGFIGALSGTVSISTLTAIAIDRYNVIVYPLNPNRSTTYLKARLMIVFCWIYSLVFSGIPLLNLGLSSYVPEGYLTCCSFDYLSNDPDARIYMYTYFFCAWCLPFFLIAYCYSHIMHVVVSANSIQSSKDKGKQELKLAAVVFGVIGLWFMAWTPYAIVALIGISGNQHLLSPLGSMLPAFFAKGGACLNPYLYAVTHPRFRLEFGKMFLGKNERNQNFNTSVSRAGGGRGGQVAETNVDGRRGTIDDSIDESTYDQ